VLNRRHLLLEMPRRRWPRPFGAPDGAETLRPHRTERTETPEGGVITALRLLSYNIRSLRDDAAAVARVIRSAAPDVACLQEAPRLGRWRRACSWLAQEAELAIVVGGRPAASNLLMSSPHVQIESTRAVKFSRASLTDIRGSAMAIMRLGNAGVLIAGIHLDLRQGPRLRHLTELHVALDQFAAPDLPVIVAGDVNDQPGSAVWAALADRGADAWTAAARGDGFTYSAAAPHQRIDAAFIDRRIRVRSAEVLDSADVRIASDHRPLLVNLQLPD
jgi:endonuclease/exonuclease/phosphatase family metal-dependent hydrolase